jgi:hypothetical protein
MTARQKGLAFQRWIKSWLEERDWIVHNQTPMGRMIKIKAKRIFISQRNDIFGCDLLALKEANRLLFIQATLDSNIKRKVEELQKYFQVKKYPFELDVQIWMKVEKDTINLKTVHFYGLDVKTNFLVWDIGKIIRKKFFKSEGIDYEF